MHVVVVQHPLEVTKTSDMFNIRDVWLRYRRSNDSIKCHCGGDKVECRSTSGRHRGNNIISLDIFCRWFLRFLVLTFVNFVDVAVNYILCQISTDVTALLQDITYVIIMLANFQCDIIQSYAIQYKYAVWNEFQPVKIHFLN